MGMIMVIGIVAKNGILLLDAEHRFRQLRIFSRRCDDSSWASPAPPYRDDSACHHRRHVAFGLRYWSGVADVQPLAFAVIGGLLSSMVLSLIFTPAIHYYLQRRSFEREHETS